MRRSLGSTVGVGVFGISVGISVLFVLWGVLFTDSLSAVASAVLVLFLVVVGPTVFIFNTFTESVGGYFANLIPMSFRTAAFGDADWLAAWTIFYWAWWISWTPFVGTFIARISKGRTIREFVLGVLVVPSLVTFVWFGVLGGSALNLSLGGDAGIVDAVSQSPAAALFATLNEFPLAVVMSVLAMVLVALFFISGAAARPPGAPAPQQMRAERDSG
jgi:glycine betaine transporter